MGKLRHAEDQAYFHSIAEEVVDLFGVDDAVLYRFAPADNETTRDPLYDEPVLGHTVKYLSYVLSMMFFDYLDTPEVGAGGLLETIQARGYISVTHLLGASVPTDARGDYLAEGDIVAFHTGSSQKIIYDIIDVTRTGWINDSSAFTGYDLTLKRSSKYLPDRKDNI